MSSGEPRPIAYLCIACLGLGAWLLLWWLNLPDVEQSRRFQALAWQEQAHTPPPPGLWTQARWLWQHRLERLYGLACLVALGAVIGLGEGLAWRRRDPLRGLRVTLWASGLVLGVLLPFACLAFLVLPWPLPLPLAGVSGAVLSGLAGFGLSAGRPSTP